MFRDGAVRQEPHGKGKQDCSAKDVPDGNPEHIGRDSGGRGGSAGDHQGIQGKIGHICNAVFKAGQNKCKNDTYDYSNLAGFAFQLESGIDPDADAQVAQYPFQQKLIPRGGQFSRNDNGKVSGQHITAGGGAGK